MNRGCLTGCLGTVLVVLVAVVLGGYFLVYRPARDFIAQVQNVTTGFTGPATTGTSGAGTRAVPATPITQAELRKFVRVRRVVRAELGEAFTPLSRLGDQIGQGGNPSVTDALNAFRQLGGKLGAARTAQRAALQREGLSAARYAVVRTQVNRALGVPEVNWQQVGQALQTLQAPDFEKALVPADPRTAKLIAPFRQELTATAALGLIGL